MGEKRYMLIHSDAHLLDKQLNRSWFLIFHTVLPKFNANVNKNWNRVCKHFLGLTKEEKAGETDRPLGL